MMKKPGVDVVHRDAALDEEHPVEQHEQPDQHPHGPAAEQDPRQQVQDGHGQRAEDDARQPPREVVVADVERRPTRRPTRRPGSRRGCSTGSPSLWSMTQGHGLEAQLVVGEHRVAVRLDDVDGGAAAVLRLAEHLDHLGGLVEQDAA